jgi:sugar lactone lactonase YvrE
LSREPKALAQHLAFPEGPRWHDGRLWFSDHALRAVYRLDLDGGVEEVVRVAGRPSGLGWQPDGRLLVVSMTDRRLLRLEDGGLVEVANLEGLAPWHCNDMVVDAAGRAYIGNFGFDFNGGEQPRPTVLLRVEPGGEVSVAADGLLFPNGMVITPEGDLLIVAETWGGRLTSFRIGRDGSLSGRAEFARVRGVAPDGICLDAEGAVWVASPSSGEAIRVAEGGEVLERVASGEPGAYACMLGGPDRRTLFICTATTVDYEQALSERSGKIVTARVDVPGAGTP